MPCGKQQNFLLVLFIFKSLIYYPRERYEGILFFPRFLAAPEFLQGIPFHSSNSPSPVFFVERDLFFFAHPFPFTGRAPFVSKNSTVLSSFAILCLGRNAFFSFFSLLSQSPPEPEALPLFPAVFYVLLISALPPQPDSDYEASSISFKSHCFHPALKILLPICPLRFFCANFRGCEVSPLQ